MAKPLVAITAIRDHPESEYPELVRIPMDDGMVVNYVIDVRQPHPCFQKVMGLLEKVPYGLSSKGYRARHAKK